MPSILAASLSVIGLENGADISVSRLHMDVWVWHNRPQSDTTRRNRKPWGTMKHAWCLVTSAMMTIPETNIVQGVQLAVFLEQQMPLEVCAGAGSGVHVFTAIGDMSTHVKIRNLRLCCIHRAFQSLILGFLGSLYYETFGFFHLQTKPWVSKSLKINKDL